MSATRLKKRTAATFAVLYGLVGVTGEGLHYLLTDPLLFRATEHSHASGGYYHTHGPDYHGHFHRHTHDGHHSHFASDDAGRPTNGTEITDDGSSHEPHGCPVLVLLSTLKLGHAGACATDIILDTLISATSHCGAVHAIDVSLSSYPRGPPVGSCA